MEFGAPCGSAYSPISGNSFDRIESPQYLNFEGWIPEAKDSFFERKLSDCQNTRSPHFKKLQKLPTDLKNELIPDAEMKNNGNSYNSTRDDNTDDNNNSEDNSLKAIKNFGDDLITSVEKLQVNQPGLIMNPKKIVTSTPFRVKGVEPMPWRSNPDVRPCTIVRPFSFEERNKQILQRKARHAQTIIQAEKAARQFRANPIPTFLRREISSSKYNKRTLSSIEKKTKTINSPPRFKARSPKVLRRPPFQPILPNEPLPLPQPFVLNSELRAKERQLFDNLMKEKERLDENIRALREAAQKRREQEEIRKLRKKLVIKAHPVRKFKCTTTTTPVSKRPLPEPTTPTVYKRQRR